MDMKTLALVKQEEWKTIFVHHGNVCKTDFEISFARSGIILKIVN